MRLCSSAVSQSVSIVWDDNAHGKAANPMNSKTINPSVRTADLVIERTLNAPRERVWQMWTDPEHLMQWWGPEYFISPSARIDLRVGGKYLFCMRTPEGQDLYSTGVYKEIVPVERLVYTDSFSDAQGSVVSGAEYGAGEDFPSELLVSVTLQEEDGKTRMTLKHAGLPAGPIQAMTGLGWNTSFDKMAKALA